MFLSYFLALFYKILRVTFAFSFANKELTRPMTISVELFKISTPLTFLIIKRNEIVVSCI